MGDCSYPWHSIIRPIESHFFGIRPVPPGMALLFANVVRFVFPRCVAKFRDS